MFDKTRVCFFIDFYKGSFQALEEAFSPSARTPTLKNMLLWRTTTSSDFIVIVNNPRNVLCLIWERVGSENPQKSTYMKRKSSSYTIVS